jgi:hypothetical protein
MCVGHKKGASRSYDITQQLYKSLNLNEDGLKKALPLDAKLLTSLQIANKNCVADIDVWRHSILHNATIMKFLTRTQTLFLSPQL